MTIPELSTYLNKNIRVIYYTKLGQQSRTGFALTLTTKKLILLLFPGSKKSTGPSIGNPRAERDDSEDQEIYCPVKKIKSIREIKGG